MFDCFVHSVNVYGVYIMSSMLHWELVASCLRESKCFSLIPLEKDAGWQINRVLPEWKISRIEMGQRSCETMEVERNVSRR